MRHTLIEFQVAKRCSRQDQSKNRLAYLAMGPDPASVVDERDILALGKQTLELLDLWLSACGVIYNIQPLAAWVRHFQRFSLR